MRTINRFFAMLIIFTFAPAVMAQSQPRPQPKGVQPVEDIPPPPNIKDVDPAKDVKVTTRQSGTDTIEEYRLGGKLYKQRVQPAVGPAYFLIDEKGEGKFVRVDGPDLKASVPMWVLFTW
ncbi:MAG: DUF2782 domain-containing protein [Betaproteobacteria bacterium]